LLATVLVLLVTVLLNLIARWRRTKAEAKEKTGDRA
jgi:hypothetical protein